MDSGKDTCERKYLRDAKVKFIGKERLEYRKKTKRKTFHPSEYLSLVVDRTDQTTFPIPHFVTPTKYQQGHGISVHFIGVLQHAPGSTPELFTITDENATPSNHIV